MMEATTELSVQLASIGITDILGNHFQRTRVGLKTDEGCQQTDAIEVRAEGMSCLRCQRARKILDRQLHPRGKLSKGQLGSKVILSYQVEQNVHAISPRRAIARLCF